MQKRAKILKIIKKLTRVEPGIRVTLTLRGSKIA